MVSWSDKTANGQLFELIKLYIKCFKKSKKICRIYKMKKLSVYFCIFNKFLIKKLTGILQVSNQQCTSM